jgi:flagellar L-ring protein precursor FlgH
MAAPQRNAMTLTDVSWTYQKADENRAVKLHDLVTVLVDDKSIMSSDHELDRKKTGYGDLQLPNWILLKGFRKVVDDPQSGGAPHIRGQIDNKIQAHGTLTTTDAVKFHIACEVVDIRPNGNLVLEGHRSIKTNEEVWEFSLSGEVRADALLPNNTVLSDNIAALRIDKEQGGQVRDSYRQGWALKWLDKWQPF